VSDLGRGAHRMYHVLEPAQQRIRVLLLPAYVDLLGAELASHRNGPEQSIGYRWAEAGIRRVIPLHRCSDRLTTIQAEVLAHPDLRAVTQQRSARQRELECVRELDPAAIALQHGCQPATYAAPVQPHLGSWRERMEHVTALLVGQPTEIELIVIAQERHPLSTLWQPHSRRQGLDERLRITASQRKPHPRIQEEVEHHLCP